MNDISPSRQKPAIFIFVVGILLGVSLNAILAWAGLEAAFYPFQYLPGEPFDGLICPPLMTTHETGTIRIDVKNPSKEVILPIIRIDISAYGMPDTREVQVKVGPGETQQIEQKVTAQNVDWGRFIFAKVYRYIAFPLHEANATCGIFVIDAPVLNGNQIYVIWLALVLIFTPAGLWMWSALLSAESGGKVLNSAKALAVLVLGGLFFSVQGVWVVGLISLALTLLMSAALFQFAMQK